MSQPNQQPNVLDAINQMFSGLEKAQSSGIYTFEESAKIFQSMLMTKEYFKNIVENQKKAQEQKQGLINKLSTIQEK